MGNLAKQGKATFHIHANHLAEQVEYATWDDVPEHVKRAYRVMARAALRESGKPTPLPRVDDALRIPASASAS